MATEEKTTQPFENLINPYTNKPVQTGKSVSFNQNIYDAPNYMQQKNDLLDSLNADMTRPKSVNEQALYNIPVVPEFMNEEYQKAYEAASWLNSLNIATPEEIEEWRAKGKMGIGETAQRLKSLKSAKYIPFVGTTAEVGYNLDMLSAVNRLKSGKQISDVERDLLVDYLRELKEIQVRGTTLPSKALNAILESVPFFIEFGVGVAAAPETFGGSLSVSGLALSKAAGKKAARKAVQKAVNEALQQNVMTGTKKNLSRGAIKSIYDNTYNAILKGGATKAAKEVGAKETAKIVAKTTPQSIIAANFGSKPLTYMTAKNTIGGFADRQLAGSMQVTDAGEAVFLEPENMALSIMKSFGSSIFDNYTETMGWAFAPVTSYFAKPVRNVLPKKFFTEFEKLVTSRYGMPAAEALKKYGYDGVIEEMGEELLNRFLCDVFGIEGLEGYTIDGFLNNVFYANDPEQWLVEALSFAAMGGAAHGTHGAYSKIKEELEKQGNTKAIERLTELANKKIYSPAEFYLEQGLIKIDGSQSAAEQELRKKFAERGVDEATANQFFNSASELEIREELRKTYEEDAENPEKRREKAVDFLANKMLGNEGYKNKDLAEKNANLVVTALEKFSETNGISIEDLIKDEAPAIRNQSEIDETPETKEARRIDERLSALEQEFNNLSDENFDENKFNELEEEYNQLLELKGQGREYYQSANIAGAEEGENLKAAKEWQEKGTDSKYFKKWFGDSKVVDESGKPLVVYHGTSYIFDEFDKNKLGSLTDAQSAKKGFWFTDGIQTAQSYAEYSNEYSGLNGLLRQQRIAETKRDWEEYDRLTEEIEKYSPETQNQIVMPVYLNITNPKIFDAQNQTFMEIQDELNDFLSDIEDYDGVIISNLKDATSNVEDEAATHYMVKNPEQIKSVDNRGTFDVENPNIYYQSDAYNEEKKNYVIDKYNNQVKFYNGEWINRKLIEEHGLDFDKIEIGDYVNFFEESKRKQRAAYNPELDKIAKEYFGTTNVINEAGYILNDGSKLDFSGKKDGGTPNRRNYDHREIVDAFIENEQYEDIGFNEFIDNGAIRFMPESKSMLIARMPSEKQMEVLENIIALYNGEVTLELVNRMDEWGWDNNFRKSYDRFSNPKKIVADIRTYYKGGKISEHKRYFQGDFTVEELESISKFRNFVYDAYDNKLSKKQQSDIFVVGKTPAKLIEAGLPNKDISIGVSVINKAKSNKNTDHNLDRDTVADVYQALFNPIAVAEVKPAATEKDKSKKYAVILDLQEGNNYVMASIKINQQTKSVIVNEIKTIHSRENYMPLLDKALNDKMLIKVDIDKIKDLLISKNHTELISDGAASLLQRIYEKQNNVKFYQSAYHGSPYKFDEFSTDSIGKGEGAQAHGWGLYYAENKDVAEGYRKRLTPVADSILYKGESPKYIEFKSGIGNNQLLEAILYRGKEGVLKQLENNRPFGEDTDELIEYVKSIDEKELKKETNGQLFEVDIPESDVLLDEDKKLNEQPEKVRKAIYEYMKDNADTYNMSVIKDFNNLPENLSGRQFYKQVTIDINGNEKDASLKLNDYGIKGITYDGRQDGRCYVIFEDKAVKVLEKYYQFAGEGSETADKHSLINAKKMLAAGENPEYVRKLTGWFKGVDGKFKYEISDKDAVVNVDSIIKARQDEIDHINLNIKDYNTRMSDLVQRHDAKEIDDKDFQEQYDSLMNRKLEEVQELKYYENKGYAAYLSKILDHEKLYAAYPSLRTVRVEFRPHSYGRLGTYSHSHREISLELSLLFEKKSELKEVLMHEVQHFIQHNEGFAVGGNPQAVEDVLADAKFAIKNSKDNKEYDFVMKKYSIVNNILLIRAIQDNPEKITKSYWWMQQGKGWYAPRKTRKKERRQYINECCQEFINYSIKKHKENNTFEGYKNYSKKDTAELKKEIRRLNYRAGKILDKLSPDYKNLSRIESALGKLERYELNTFDLYQRLAGETEARNTSNRMNLSDEERLEKSPAETSDVPETEQLVVFDDGTMAFSESDMSEDYQENLFFDNRKARDLRRVKGSYIPAENLIELFKNADESTIVHEFAHWWLERLVKYSEFNEELATDVEAIRKFVKNDGEEFTREQHEKFARGFEAYIRSGYAKNNRLKRIFEDFKNALLAIYDSIKRLGFKDDEMPEIQKLYDRLLTTERERIRATVFDKVAEIDEKIEAIRANEVKEFAELDKIYKDNIAYLNRQSDKKRSVQEYLDLAETMTGRETKEVKEFKKRFKDATLDILSVYSGKPKTWVANSRNWEELQNIIGNGSDKITASDGMKDKWREFYTDTGVSYDTDEVGGDDELARQAFEVLASGNYNKTFDESYEFEEINKFSAKVDYLAAKVKTLKGEEKNNAIEALFSLFNDMPSMPDEVTASLFEKIDGIAEKADEEQREDFNKKIIPSVPIMQQLQYIITQKLNNLKVYNPETRYKMRLNKSHRLYRYIKDVNSVNSAKKQIKRINDFVIDDMRTNQRFLLHKEIQKQIKVNSKVVRVGTLTKGKFDWKTNTVFAELVQMNKMKREDAEKELGALVQIQDAAKGENRDSYDENETSEFNKPNDFQDNLRKKYLQYRSMRVQDLDVTHTIQLLQDILELKEKGRQAKSEEDFINKTQRWNTRNNLLDVLEVTKNSGAAFGANWIAGVGRGVSLNGGTLANWESLLNSIFDKNTAQKYSLLGDEAKSETYARKHMLNFYKKASEIYEFNPATTWDRFLDYDYMQPLIKLMQEYNDEKYTYIQQVYSVNSPDGVAKSNIEISRAQMITMFAWSLNDKLEQRLFTQFGLKQIREMFEERLSEQDRQLAWALVDTCEGMREDINEIFIRTTGLSLPAVQNYFPSKAERVQSDIDMYHDAFVKSSNPSFIKERKVCSRIPMKPLAPLEILIPHINKTAKYVVMSEKVNFLNKIFKDTAIKTKMQEIWGSKDGADIYQTLINKLAASTFTNYSRGTNLVAGALDTLSRNYITSSIGFSPKVAIGQLLSVINYAENMPTGVWAKGFIETLKHPVENFKYMLDNCEYLQARLAGNSQNEVIAILTSEKDKFRTLRNFMTSNVKWGDIIAITIGGKPYVDYLMQQGMTKEDAFNKFVEDTMRAQQAGTTSSISEWQAAQAKNCLTRMFFAFRNTDMQYERKFIDTIIQLKKGDISKAEGIKKLFIYKIFNPFMFTSFLQNLSIVALISAAFRGDDPDDTIGGFLKSAVEAVMLGGMTAYGFAGFIAKSFMESLVALYDKEYKHFENDVPIMSDFDRQVQKYLKGDLTLADYVDALAMGTELGFGLPASKVVNSAEGLGDIARGNIGVGLSRLAGWGKYTSTKAWTGEEPEKKKRKKKK